MSRKERETVLGCLRLVGYTNSLLVKLFAHDVPARRRGQKGNA
jgi:hypothetical protein